MHRDRPAASVQQVLKHVCGLQNSRTVRERTGQFWAEGVRQFVRAAEAGLQIETIIHSRILLKHELAQTLVRRLATSAIECVTLTPEQFRSISIAPHASGIGAIVKQHWTPLNSAAPYRGLCWLVIERVRSPGNLGTILRTAEATGVTGVAFLGREVDPFDPAVIRASMGGVFHLQLVRATHERFGRWARGVGMQLIGLSPRGPTLWTDLSSAGPLALLVGDERGGLSETAMSMCNSLVRLPMTGHADSLNVGIATGVMLYELLRQRSG